VLRKVRGKLIPNGKEEPHAFEGRGPHRLLRRIGRNIFDEKNLRSVERTPIQELRPIERRKNTSQTHVGWEGG